MKFALASLFLVVLASSCKDDKIDETLYKGEYVHIGDAAVLSTDDEIYAVKIDDNAAQLDAKAEEFMRTPYDMVQVIVTGKLMPNPRKQETGEGWDQMIVIDKIIEVRKSSSSAVMKEPVQNQEDN